MYSTMGQAKIAFIFFYSDTATALQLRFLCSFRTLSPLDLVPSACAPPLPMKLPDLKT